MAGYKLSLYRQTWSAALRRNVLTLSVMLFAVAGLSACGNKEKAGGQSLVKVNGQEITVHQVNEELMRGNIPAAQKEVATKQLIEALIDRQLLQGEAARDKVDRDPAVMQAIERAKSQIIAQAYMQKRLAKIAKPTKEESDAYFTAHPEYFSQRKVFDMNQLIVASKDFNNDLKVALGTAKSMEDVAAWLDSHRVEYVRNKMTKSTADLPAELTKNLMSMRKGQTFAIQEGDRSVLVALADIKDSPVTAATAMPQIGQFLYNKKVKEASDAELARLRAAAKIEYLNQPKIVDSAPKAAVAAPVAGAKPADESIKRGMAGL